MLRKGLKYSFRNMHLSAFVGVLNPVPPVLMRAWIMAENLSLLGICTVANVVTEPLSAQEEVDRHHVCTHICPHV